MAEVAVQLVSVERMLWSGQATIVTAETTEGEIGVLPGHEPMLGQLVDGGVVTITTPEGDRRVAAVQGGFLSVSPGKVTILADFAEWATEVDVHQAESDLDSAEEPIRARAKAKLKARRRMKA